MSVIQANASVTHTYGNVACLAMDEVTKYFDDNYFKKTHISTKLAHRQLDIYKTKIEFWKLGKPLLLMRPRIEVNDSSVYFYGSAMTNRMFSARSPMEYSHLVKLVESKNYGVNLSFLWNRAKIYYDIVIIVDTFNEQLNIANFLRGYFIQDTPYMVKTTLESYVPKSAIYPLTDYVGIDRNDTASILSFLNTYGETPFTYKFKDGSGNDEFFALYPTNVEMIPSELSLDDGSTKGLITDTYTISFTLSCEFNIMAFYYLFLRDGDDKFNICPHTDINKDAKLTTLFTIPLLYDLKMEPGWRLFSAPAAFLQGGKDSISLNAVLTNGIINVFRYHNEMNIPTSIFFKLRVFKNRKELTNGVDYKLDETDINNLTLYVYNCDSRATYRICIIVNTEYINNMTAELTEFTKEK